MPIAESAKLGKSVSPKPALPGCTLTGLPGDTLTVLPGDTLTVLPDGPGTDCLDQRDSMGNMEESKLAGLEL